MFQISFVPVWIALRFFQSIDYALNKQCPRCKNRFQCQVENVANCQCSTVQITEATRQFLQSTNYDCLCSNCLSAINNLVQFAAGHNFPKQYESMIEGLHFYLEDGMFVFTELYHLQRGYCCRNGCRHCAYGFLLSRQESKP